MFNKKTSELFLEVFVHYLFSAKNYKKNINYCKKLKIGERNIRNNPNFLKEIEFSCFPS